MPLNVSGPAQVEALNAFGRSWWRRSAAFKCTSSPRRANGKSRPANAWSSRATANQAGNALNTHRSPVHSDHHHQAQSHHISQRDSAGRATARAHQCPIQAEQGKADQGDKPFDAVHQSSETRQRFIVSRLVGATKNPRGPFFH